MRATLKTGKQTQTHSINNLLHQLILGFRNQNNKLIDDTYNQIIRYRSLGETADLVIFTEGMSKIIF